MNLKIETLPKELKNKVDELVDLFWRHGVSNVTTAIEQITYLMLLKLTNKIHNDNQIRGLVWNELLNSKDAFTYYSSNFYEIEEFCISRLGSSFKSNIKMEIPSAIVFDDIIHLIDDIFNQVKNSHIGLVYSYLLTKIVGQSAIGQYSTPDFLIKFLVELMQPKPNQTFCDPACGTGGFLLGVNNYISEIDANYQFNVKLNGFDHDATMVRFAQFNMLFNAGSAHWIQQMDTLREEYNLDSYDIVLMNPPFSNKINFDSLSRKLRDEVGYSINNEFPSELLFSYLALSLLKNNGRCAVIVPEGTLFSDARYYKEFREKIITKYQLEGVISLPSGAFKPYTNVKASVLFISKIGVQERAANGKVWFYEVPNDAFNLDSKKNEIQIKFLSDLITSWNTREEKWGVWEDYFKTQKGLLKGYPPKWNQNVIYATYNEIQRRNYNLSMSNYRPHEISIYEQIVPEELIKEIINLEDDIKNDLNDLLSQLHDVQNGNLTIEQDDMENTTIPSNPDIKIEENMYEEENAEEKVSFDNLLIDYRAFIENLAKWQKDLLKIFCESSRPLACHEANKKLGNESISIQDALQSVKLFEFFGLLEKDDLQSMYYPKGTIDTKQELIKINSENLAVKMWRVTKK
jgi:type I restriction enzyme M protein